MSRGKQISDVDANMIYKVFTNKHTYELIVAGTGTYMLYPLLKLVALSLVPAITYGSMIYISLQSIELIKSLIFLLIPDERYKEFIQTINILYNSIK